MIKKANYIQLTLLMLMLFVVYLFSAQSISFYNHKDNYTESIPMNDNNKENKNAEILLITGKQDGLTKSIEKELTYLKKDFRVEESLFQLNDNDFTNIQIIILASEQMQSSYDYNLIKKYLNKGIHMIFVSLPIEELDKEWYDLLGINTLQKTSSQDGLVIFEGFLLGGKKEYKDFSVHAYDIKVASSCKTYIAGFQVKDDDIIFEKDKLQDILWRNIYHNSQVYVVNGNFFNSPSSIGIISGILAQIYPDFIYPIINAKALIINNAPQLSIENTEELERSYARDSKRLFEDILLPDLIALSLTADLKPTFYGLNYIDEWQETNIAGNTYQFSLLRKELNKLNGEIGVSTYDKNLTYNLNKTMDSMKLFQSIYGDNKIKSVHTKFLKSDVRDTLIIELDQLAQLSTVITDAQGGELFSNYNSRITLLPVISRGFRYEEKEFFQLQSMVTALGVILHEIDMKEIIYPKDKEDEWSVVQSDLNSMVHTYWKNYKVFDSVNISSFGERVSGFLNRKDNIIIEDNRLQIKMEGFQKEAFFILRTNKKIRRIKDGSFKKIEENVYLITAKKENIEIFLNENILWK